MSDIYEAIAVPARRAILDELHDRNGQTLFELCARLTMKHNLSLRWTMILRGLMLPPKQRRKSKKNLSPKQRHPIGSRVRTWAMNWKKRLPSRKMPWHG